MRTTMNDLVEAICKPDASEEEKRLALSIAYQRGRSDALDEVDAKLAKRITQPLPFTPRSFSR